MLRISLNCNPSAPSWTRLRDNTFNRPSRGRGVGLTALIKSYQKMLPATYNSPGGRHTTNWLILYRLAFAVLCLHHVRGLGVEALERIICET